MIAMRDAKKALDPTSRRPDFQVAAGAPSKPDPQNYESTLAQNKYLLQRPLPVMKLLLPHKSRNPIRLWMLLARLALGGLQTQQ